MMISKSVKQVTEHYGDEIAQRVITEDELDSITAGYPIFLRNNLDWAFFGLERVLKRNPHIKEGWRDLVKLFRETSGPKPKTLICKTPHGVSFKTEVLIDSHSFKYPALNHVMLNLIEELDAISNFDPSLHMSDLIYREAQRISASGSKVDGDTNSKIVEEIEAKYLSARHGAKGLVKKEIAEKYFVSERHIDNLVKELKKNR